MKITTLLGLRIIAFVKIVKGVALCGLSLGIFNLIHKDLAATALHFVQIARISPENRYVELLLVKVGLIEPRTLRLFGELSALEASIQLVEGLGLWFGAAWAEYVVVVSTGIYIPEECLVLHRHFTWFRVSVLVVNAAMFAYVAYAVWTRYQARRSCPATPA
ncbi:MAG TPA: DUF2127 domain-containing protein [Opitutaceae bacterium]|nr:DUF2127 domain-containing protein [Opitutaceae bacterium]